jgi:hypothetical protein
MIELIDVFGKFRRKRAFFTPACVPGKTAEEESWTGKAFCFPFLQTSCTKKGGVLFYKTDVLQFLCSLGLNEQLVICGQ